MMDRRPVDDVADPEVPADAAARGIIRGVMLSSIVWVGLAITLWTLW